MDARRSTRDLQLAVARMVAGYVRFVAQYEPHSASERATLDHEWSRMLGALSVFTGTG